MADYILVIFNIILLVIGSFCMGRVYYLLTINKSKNNDLIAAVFKNAAISIPYIVVCITASIIGNNEIAIGILLGSNIFLLLVVTGKTFLSGNYVLNDLEKNDILARLSYAGFSTVILLYLAGNYLSPGNGKHNQIIWQEGLVLIILSIFYIVLQAADIIKFYKNNSIDIYGDIIDILKYISARLLTPVNILLLITALVLIITGSVILTLSSYKVAILLKISQNTFSVFIDVIIIFIPLIMLYGVMDDAGMFYNVSKTISFSANLMVFMAGISPLICSIKVTTYNIYDIIFLAASYFTAWICIKFSKKGTRLTGCLMITMYIFYMVFVFKR